MQQDASGTFDAIVIGLGAVGSATLYQLGLKFPKLKILGIDQFSPPHTNGSSHGDTRITRKAIGEGSIFTPLAVRSCEIFKDVEQKYGKKLLHEIGGLIIAGDKATGVHGVGDFFGNTIAAAKAFDIEHEMLDTAAIKNRFPQFKVEDGETAYFEKKAGYLLAEECIRAQLNIAEANGATIKRNTKVKELKESGGITSVHTDNGVFSSSNVIVSAGSWVADFIPPELSKLFSVERQVQYWFDIRNAFAQYNSPPCPIFIWELPIGGHVYGFPAIDGPEGGFKLGASKYNYQVTPETIDRNVSDAEISTMFREQVEPFFAGATEKCLRTAVCLYTSTSDAAFVIDKLPGFTSVLLASPCSGHGFKHSAAIGETIAELTVTGKSQIDVSSFTFAAQQAKTNTNSMD